MAKLGTNNIEQQLLENNKIKLLEPYIGSMKKHNMQCLVCNHIWISTPDSKMTSFKKHKTNGCPSCKDINLHSVSRNDVLVRLKERGIEVLDPNYDGRRHIDNAKKYDKILVRNVHCGHEFECSPTNLIVAEVNCSVCRSN